MVQIIYRGEPYLPTVSRFLERAEQQRAEEHAKETARRKKRQQTTLIAGTAVGGAVLGGFLGPALAAGNIAAAGVAAESAALATGAGASTAAGIGAAATASATTTSAITAGLTGAGLGATFGSQIGNEDYGGALLTGLGAANQVVQYGENQQLYGFQPTPEDRAGLARLAAQSGTTVGQLAQQALQTGTTVQQQLGIARNAEDRRDLNAATQRSYYGAVAGVSGRNDAEDAAKEQYLNLYDQLGEVPGFTYTPDQGKLEAAGETLDSAGNSAADYIATNGKDGATFEEQGFSLQEAQRQIAQGRHGRLTREPPPLVVNRADGTTRKIPRGEIDEFDDFYAFPKANGDFQFKSFAKTQPRFDPKLTPEQREQALFEHAKSSVLRPERVRELGLDQNADWSVDKDGGLVQHKRAPAEQNKQETESRESIQKVMGELLKDEKQWTPEVVEKARQRAVQIAEAAVSGAAELQQRVAQQERIKTGRGYQQKLSAEALARYSPSERLPILRDVFSNVPAANWSSLSDLMTAYPHAPGLAKEFSAAITSEYPNQKDVPPDLADIIIKLVEVGLLEAE